MAATVSNTAATASTPSGVYGVLRVPAPFDTTFSLVTSPLCSPTVLAVVRLSLAVYTTGFSLSTLIYEGVVTHTAEQYFTYFTRLSYVGLVAYFWAAGVQTLFFARSGTSYPLQRWPRPLQFLHVLLQSTVLTFPILVTAVFWALLSSPDTFSTKYNAWNNISEHALNIVFAAFEIFCTNTAPAFRTNPHAVSMPWIHLPFVILILVGYLGLAYITKAAQGFYTYSFLDPSVEHALLAAYIAGIGVGGAILFILVRYICMLRAWMVARYKHLPRSEENLEDAAEKGSVKEWESDWEQVRRPSLAGTRSVVGM